MNSILQKITDTVTVLFPALIAILGILNLTGLVQGFEVAEQIIMIVLGAVSAVCSIWFNTLTRRTK